LINFRKTLFGAAAGIALAVPSVASAQFDSSTTTTLMALLLANELGVQTNLVVDLALTDGYATSCYYAYPPYTRTCYDLAPVFVIYMNAPRRRYRPIEILERRRLGWGWDRIALWAGIPAPRYRVLNTAWRFDPNYWGRVVTVHRLYVPPATVVTWRSRGMGWRDLALATVTAREARQPLQVVAERWRTNHNWNAIATHYRITPTVVRTRVAQFRRTRAVPTQWRERVAMNSVPHPGRAMRITNPRTRVPARPTNRVPSQPKRPVAPHKPSHPVIPPRTSVRTHGNTRTVTHSRVVTHGTTKTTVTTRRTTHTAPPKRVNTRVHSHPPPKKKKTHDGGGD
jgi:hypothetical protein